MKDIYFFNKLIIFKFHSKISNGVSQSRNEGNIYSYYFPAILSDQEIEIGLKVNKLKGEGLFGIRGVSNVGICNGD